MRRCFFIGHRDAPERIYPALCAAVERLVCQRRITDFLVGNHGAFDRMAARAVMAVREQHPQVHLTLLLSRFPRNPWTVPTGFDGSLYPEELEGVPPAVTIVRANRWAVERADCLIGYVRYTPSNAAKVAGYAQRRGVPVVLLQEPDDTMTG